MPFRTYPNKKVSSTGDLFASRAPEGTITAHIDGGARGNPGPAGFGVHLQDADGKTIAELSEFLGHATNNVAEYSALIAALEYAIANKHRAMRIFSDSELLVKQMRGQYKVSNLDLKKLHARANELRRELDYCEIQHVRREQNKEADRLANLAMDRGTRQP